MRWLGVVFMLLATHVAADPLPRQFTAKGALRTAPEVVNVRTNAAFRTLGDQLILDAGAAASGGTFTSATAAATNIDASAGALGPIQLTRSDTLGTAGAVNVNAAAQQYSLDQYDGAHTLGAHAPLLVTRNPQTAALVGMRLQYALALHVYAVVLAATYALRDDLDVSVALPIVTTNLDLHVDAQVIRQAVGNRFVRVHGTPLASVDAPRIQSTGPGDLTARLKWKLPLDGPLRYGLVLSCQFPTGNPDAAQGGGTYLLNLGATAVYPWALRDRHGEVTANVTMAFDLRDSTQARVLYGIGTSAELLLRPFPLVGVVEFLGRSQLDPTPAFGETGVVVLTSPTQLATGPALGLDVGRKDYFDVSFGIRVPITKHILAFATGVAALNTAGFRPSGITPTIGIGGGF